MPKIAINRAIGGFTLSHKAVMRYAELIGITIFPYYQNLNNNTFVRLISEDIEHIDEHNRSDSEEYYGDPWYFYVNKNIIDRKNSEIYDECFKVSDIKRDDSLLIQVIEELGDDATGSSGKIKVVDVPDDVDWEIEENDAGYEWVQEKPRKWY